MNNIYNTQITPSLQMVTPEGLAAYRTWLQTTLSALPLPDNPTPPGWATLKPHEQTVVRLIAGGCTTADIADRQNLSKDTIHSQRTVINRKLGLSGTNCLVRFAERHQAWLLQPPPA